MLNIRKESVAPWNTSEHSHQSEHLYVVCIHHMTDKTSVVCEHFWLSALDVSALILVSALPQ